MMNIIKTAIITIVISIISGLLVEHFKNLGPRILCNIGNGKPIKKDNKRVYAYIITVSSLSKKIIHELTLNVQNSQSSLKIADAKITKGLKFESSIKNNILDIYIPFLSKGDKFSVTVYVESRNKPVIVMRSPENFKRIDSEEQNGLLSSLFNLPKNSNEPLKNNEKAMPNDKDDYTMVMNKPLGDGKTMSKGILNGNKKISENKKVLVAIASVVLLVFAGVLVKVYFKGTPSKTQNPTVKADVGNPSTNSSESSDETNKNQGIKPSSSGKTTNPASSTSSNGTNKNTSVEPSNSGTSQNTSSGQASSNTNTKAPTSETPTNAATNQTNQINQTNKTTDVSPSTNSGTSENNNNTNSSTGGTNSSTNTNPQSSGNSQNSGSGSK